MLFDLIFLTIFVAGWLLGGYLPWVVLSVITRGNAGLSNLPICLFAALVVGLAVPILFRDDAIGALISFSVAPVAATAVLAARRVASAAWDDVHRTTPKESA